MELLDAHDVLISTTRWAAGLAVGSLLALAVAVAVSASTLAREALMAMAGFLRALPILALVPLVQKTLGVGEPQKILLIGWACFFPVLVSTMIASGRRMPDLELRLISMKMRAGARFRHYELPRILFGFISGVEISIGVGWLTVVAAELIGTFSHGPFRGGLGYAVYVAFENGSFAIGILCLLIFGVLGLSTVMIWRRASTVLAQAAGYDRTALTSA